MAKSLVELRLARDPWNSQLTGKWTLSQTRAGDVRWKLTKDGTSVVGTGLRTSGLISQTLEPLAKESRIHCILQLGHDMLHAEIPSLRLKFCLTSGATNLQSLEYRSISVDHD